MAKRSDVARQFKAAMLDAAKAAVNDKKVMIVRGHPGIKIPDEVISLGRVTARQEPGPMSATNRARDLDLTLDVTISIWRKGGIEVETVVEDRAYELLDLIEEYLRGDGTTAGNARTTLGGLVWWCFCTSHEAAGETDPALIAKGRLCEVVAVFTAKTRITNNI